MLRLELVTHFIIVASLLLSSLLPASVSANSFRTPHNPNERAAIGSDLPLRQTTVCDEFSSGLGDWELETATANTALTNPAGVMRLSASAPAPSGQYSEVTAKKNLSGYTGAITVTSTFTSYSGTTIHFWVEYADASTDYIFQYGTTPSNPTVHTANYTTNPNKVPVALHFTAKASWLFPPFQVDVNQICITSASTPPPSSPTTVCDEFSSGLDGWEAETTTVNTALTNPAGMMRLSASAPAPSGQYSEVTAKKNLSGYTGAITVTSTFTSYSGTTIHFWVEYADASTDYIFQYGTTPSNPTVHTANYTTNPNKVPVALHFSARASWLFPPFQVDVNQVCVATSPQQNGNCTTYDFSTGDKQGWEIIVNYGVWTGTSFLANYLSGPNKNIIHIRRSFPAGTIITGLKWYWNNAGSKHVYAAKDDWSADFVSLIGDARSVTALSGLNEVINTNMDMAGEFVPAGTELTKVEVCFSPLKTSPLALNFSATKGSSNPAPQTFSISHIGDTVLNWTAAENLSWLGLSSLSGTTPATITTSVNINGLSPGQYSGSITINSDGIAGSPQTVNVTLTIQPPALVPIQLSAEPGHANIRLAWNPINDPTVIAYRISRGVISNSLSAIATISNTVYFDADPALVANTAYCYQVAALRANNSVVTTSNTACTLFGQVALWIPDVWAAPGQTAVIPVNIHNATGLRIAASDIWLDFDRTVVEPLSIQATPLSAGYQWAYSITNHSGFSRVKISVVGGSAPVLQGDGSLFWLEVQVVGASGAQTQLNLREFVSGTGGSTIYTPDDLFTPVPLTLQDGIFQVANAYILGDPNGNGVVEAVDAYIALQIASGKLTPTSQQLQASDVNGNGEVDAGDASMILYYAVHGEWPSVPVTGSRVQAAGAILLDLDDVSGLPGAGVVTTLRAQNLSGWAGGKFVIAYDPAVVESITNVTPTGLAQNFSGQFYDNGTGLLTLALADETPVSGSGAMATIALHLAPNATTGSQTQLTLVHAELNDIAGRDFATSALQQLIERGSGTVSIGAGQQPDAVYLPVIVK